MMEFLRAIEASAPSMWMKESGTAFVTILAFHSIGLAFLVGISSGTALRILGAARRIPLAAMKDFFPLMWIGLAVNATTGILLLAMYPAKFLTDPTFYIKMTTVVIVLFVLSRLFSLAFDDGGSGMETTDGERRARILARTMLVLWLVALTAGRVTAYTLPTKLATAGAVAVFAVLALMVGYAAMRLGWIKPAGQGA